MTKHIRIPVIAICMICTVGCQFPGRSQQARFVDPALPMTLSRDELVDYLNGQNQGLDGWRCTSTRMKVKLPNGLSTRLKGNIACQAPQYFRLTASNSIANADLGSNASRCWVYIKPGESALLTWKHEDTSLLQQIPSGVPYIDPNWLMLVLGVTPLDPADYEISPRAGDGRELWLTAVENGPHPHSRSMRRIIKVDTVRGVIREHGLYDSEAHPLVVARLSDHRARGSHLIPQTVRLMFPQMKSEMTLTFDEVETNPHMPDQLWQLPDQNVEVVDLGAMIRQQLPASYARPQPTHDRNFVQSRPSRSRAQLQPPVFHGLSEAEVAANDQTAMAPPDWDVDTTCDENSTENVSYEGPADAPRRRGVWPLWRR